MVSPAARSWVMIFVMAILFQTSTALGQQAQTNDLRIHCRMSAPSGFSAPQLEQRIAFPVLARISVFQVDYQLDNMREKP